MMGHSAPIQNICISKDIVVSSGGDEGIFVWKFLGYVGKNERLIDLANY